RARGERAPLPRPGQDVPRGVPATRAAGRGDPRIRLLRRVPARGRTAGRRARADGAAERRRPCDRPHRERDRRKAHGDPDPPRMREGRMSLSHPVGLLALLVIPLALGLVWLARRRPPVAAVRYTNLDVLAVVAAETRSYRRYVPLGLALAALAALAV